MKNVKNNEKNKSAVILSPEVGVGISGASAESVVSDGAKTKCYSAKRDLYARSSNGSRLKMTTSVSFREANKHRFLFNLIRRFLEKFFKKNFRDDSSCFGFAKILALALLLTFITTAESSAECYATEHHYTSRSCYDSWNPGVVDNCGNGCTYTYNNGKLTVTATKPTAVIPEGMFSPKYYEEKAGFPNITNIEIAGEFDTIGMHAFINNSAWISGKDNVLYVNNLGHNVFGSGNNIGGTIIVDDKQTTIGTSLWYLANLNATVILPPTIKSISGMAIYGVNLGTNAKIYCGAENCEQMFIKSCDSLKGGNATYKPTCQKNLTKLLSSGKLLAYPDGCTKMGAIGCTKCKNSNFKLNDGECDRLRYTPAEAAEVLRDDNTNSVTITFKK